LLGPSRVAPMCRCIHWCWPPGCWVSSSISFSVLLSAKSCPGTPRSARRSNNAFRQRLFIHYLPARPVIDLLGVVVGPIHFILRYHLRVYDQCIWQHLDLDAHVNRCVPLDGTPGRWDHRVDYLRDSRVPVSVLIQLAASVDGTHHGILPRGATGGVE